MTNNDRTNSRSRLIYSLRVFDEEGDALLGTVVDITPDGIMLRGREEVPVGKDYALRMALPTIYAAEGKIQFKATTKWCRRNPNGDHYSVGFQFAELSGESKAIILKLIRNYCLDEGDEEDDLGFGVKLPLM